MRIKLSSDAVAWREADWPDVEWLEVEWLSFEEVIGIAVSKYLWLTYAAISIDSASTKKGAHFTASPRGLQALDYD